MKSTKLATLLVLPLLAACTPEIEATVLVSDIEQRCARHLALGDGADGPGLLNDEQPLVLVTPEKFQANGLFQTAVNPL